MKTRIINNKEYEIGKDAKGEFIFYENIKFYIWKNGGGLVENPNNIYGDARISGNAWISGNARIYGDVQISGNAWISGNARISGNAWKVTPLQIHGTIWNAGWCKRGVLKIGCEEHTIKEWRKQWKIL